MAGVRRKPSSSGRYQGFFIDQRGKKRFFTGSKSKRETLQIARKLEDDARQVRLGYREPRQSHFKYRDRSFAETAAAYIEWGRCQGGHKGRLHPYRLGSDPILPHLCRSAKPRRMALAACVVWSECPMWCALEAASFLLDTSLRTPVDFCCGYVDARVQGG